MTGRIASLALVAAVFAGCGAADADESVTASVEAATSAPAEDPVDLIGSWLVTEADEEPGVVLRIAGDVTLWRACGVQLGQWDADAGGLFVAGMDSWTGECSSTQRRTKWLDRSVAYRVTDEGVWLTGADGGLMARLVPGGRPTAHPNLLPELATPPEVTDQLRRYLTRPTPAPLPAGVRPASPDQLIGRWVPADGFGEGKEGPSYVEIRADGSWQGFHGAGLGCPSGGRWVGSDGRLLTTIGPVPAVFCPGVSVAGWFHDASRAGVAGAAGDVLVLFDAAGAETGRLKRAV